MLFIGVNLQKEEKIGTTFSCLQNAVGKFHQYAVNESSP